MNIFVLVLQFGLAGVLAVAAVGKLRDLHGSRKAVNDFGVPKRLADPLGTFLPFAELLLAAGLLVGATARLAAAGALLLFLAFIVGIGWNLRQGKHPDCHCFGDFHSSPASWRTLARNAVFVVMAAIIVAAGGEGVADTYDDLSSAGQVGVWLALLISVIGAGQWWFLDRTLKHQKELKSDLEALHTEMVFARYDASLTSPDEVRAELPVPEPVGEPAPAFDLPGLAGGRLTLELLQEQGNPILLIFTAPDCAYCLAMYPEVMDWSRRFGRDLTVAVIGRGEIEANREKLAEFVLPYVAIDEDSSMATAYHAEMTPSGVLISPEGRLLVGDVAKGRFEIQKLVGRALQRMQSGAAAQAMSEPAPVVPESANEIPDTLTESWPAMDFDLPSPDGGRVTLDGLLARGNPILAIFWSPSCGYCEEIGTEVGEWVRRFSSDITFAFISNGPIEDNLEQIAQFGLINVGLQDANEVMQFHGGTGTPSAILIRPDGFIQDEPAIGAYEIRRLLGRAIARAGSSPGQATRRTTIVDTIVQDRDSDEGEIDQHELIRAYLQRSASSNAPEIGTPGTRLPWADLDGSFVGIDDYRGDDLVLVFWGVDCAFSQRMLLDLKEWELGAGQTTKRVLIISSGEAAANRAQGLRSRIVLDDNFSAGNSFGVTGTPAAIRLDAEGRVASDLAEGADAVLDLLYDFSESRAALPAR